MRRHGVVSSGLRAPLQEVKRRKPMSTNGTVQKTVGQVAELVGDIVKFLIKFLSTLSGSELQTLVSKKKEVFARFESGVNEILGSLRKINMDIVFEWKKFYSEMLGVVDVDLSGLVIPPKPDGDWWLIVVMPITYKQIIIKLRTLFRVWTYADDLDKVLNMAMEQRKAADTPYAIWVRAVVEADPDNASKSANDLANTNQITLMERLLLEGVYFKRTGKHLDIHNWTLCAGSRVLAGRVPRVSWNADYDWLHVGWDGVDGRRDNLRSRSVSC